VFFVLFVFVLCLVYPTLPVSLDCLRPVSCVPNVTSVSRLSSSCVLCTQRYQCRWIVFVLCLVCPTLPVSLDCLRPVSCVPNVTSVSRLSSSCVLCTQRYQCLWIVFVLCVVCPTLPVSLDCLRSVSCFPMGTQDTGRRQSRDTGNVGYARHRTKTIQRHW
jgi:hypothetical protein